MGSALGCAHKSKETGKTAKYDTKGGKKVEKEELQGKLRYLGEIGAAIYAIEEKKKHIGHFISFVGEGNKVTFVCHETAKDKIFVAQFTDEEFQAKKEASNITLSYNAVFKSIVTETAKGKVKVSIRENEVTAAFNISSVKDPRANQLFTVNLELCLLPKPKAKNMYIIDPIGRMISKRRCNVEEKEKEMRVSKVHMQGVLSAANIAHSRATNESIQKVIVPILEQAAQHSKISSEMMAKVEQMERRIRKLKTRGASNKHPLDLMYEEGGSRNFLHLLLDTEEHLPIDERHIDWLKTHLPLSDGESLEILAKPPKDHALASIKDPMLLQAMSIFSKLDNWDMNMFDLEKLTGGNALYVSTYAMLQKLDLINHFKIDDRILRNFLKAVQSGYHPNPYHNKTHAADVTHINYYIMTKGGLIDKLNLPREDVFAGVLAGAIHFDHPGFNNNFHTRTNAYLATLYNDRSILENHHCACVFEILRLPQYDILNGFTEEQRRTVRDTVIEMVLATDMGNHAETCNEFKKTCSVCEFQKETDFAGKQAVPKMDRRITITRKEVEAMGDRNGHMPSLSPYVFAPRWPTDFILEMILRFNTKSKSDSRDSNPTEITSKITSKISSVSSFREMYWGCFATTISMILFAVGFDNPIAIGIWVPFVIMSFIVLNIVIVQRSGLCEVHSSDERRRVGIESFSPSKNPLAVWILLLTALLLITALLTAPKCQMLVYGAPSFTIVALAMISILVGNVNRLFVWVHMAMVLMYVVMVVSDATKCDASTVSHIPKPKVAIMLLFQQFVPIIFIVGSFMWGFHNYQKWLTHLTVSDKFAFDACHAATVYDIEELKKVCDAYELSSSNHISVSDAAVIAVCRLIEIFSSRSVKSRVFTRSKEGRPVLKEKRNNVNNDRKNSALSNTTEVPGKTKRADENVTTNTTNTDLLKLKEENLLNSNGSLSPKSSTTEENCFLSTTSGRTHLPPSMVRTVHFVTLFALPRLSNYMKGPLSSSDLAQMFIIEFFDAVNHAVTKWSGYIVFSSFNMIVAKFTSPIGSVAAATEVHSKLQSESEHHKDSALNMSCGHRPLTLSLLTELFYDTVKSNSLSLGFSPAETIFENIIELYGNVGERCPPDNLVATYLVDFIEDHFDVKASSIHLSLTHVIKCQTSLDSLLGHIEDVIPPVEVPALPVVKHYKKANPGSPRKSSLSIIAANQDLDLDSTNVLNDGKGKKHLSPQVIEVWNSIDIEQKGYLELHEIETLIKKIGLRMTKDEMRKFFQAVDVDGSGTISFVEFEEAYFSSTLGGATVMSSVRRAGLAMADSNEKEFFSLLDKVWRKYDTDGLGKLSENAVGSILIDLGMNHTAQEIHWLVVKLDKDHSGFVEYDEFMLLFSGEYANDFNAVKERIQSVTRVMMNKNLSVTYSTPDQLLRDYRVRVKETLDRFATWFLFFYITYTFGTVSFGVALGPLGGVPNVLKAVNVIIDIVYAIWVIAKTFYLPKEVRGRYIFKNIFSHHIKTVEFYVDMISIVPVEILFFIIGSPRNGGIISYYRVNKLFSVYHLDWCYKLITREFDPALTRAVNALLYFFIFAHIFACSLVGFARSTGEETMLELVGTSTLLTDESTRYIKSLYWAILMLSGSLGGDVLPSSNEQLAFLSMGVIVGLPVYTVVLGTIGNAVNVENSYTRYLDKIDSLRSFLEYTQLPKDFEDDIISYYQHVYCTTNTLDITENPLDDLPIELSIQVTVAVGTEMLKSVPIFKSASTNLEFVHELTTKLVPKVIEPLATVMRKGEIGTDMYFITYGNFNIVVENIGIVFTLGKGNFFGEIALIHNGKRSATIVNSAKFGNVLTLDKESFQEVARFFPDCLSQVYKAAEDRIKQMREKEKE